MRTALVFVLLLGCSYSPDSFDYPGRWFPGQRVTVGCLDISVHRRPDLDVVKYGTDAVVLDYNFGNRCDKPVVVDLVRIPVIARTVDGDEVTLTPFDPNLEMIATTMDARAAGGEAIAYPFTEPVAQVCANVAAIGGYAEARWLCFSSAKLDAPKADAPSTDAPIDENASREQVDAPTTEETAP